MKYVITIDGGTTNTRCCLWNDKKKLIWEEKRGVGVRDTAIDGSNARLKSAVRECLEGLLEAGGITYGEIERVVASGMITSDVGLVEIPHLTAPCGLEEFQKGIAVRELPEICPLPISFIPGLKNSSEKTNRENFEAMDIMRGEEVESLAVIDRFFEGKPLLLVLPGSHNKFAAVDGDGRITGCLTSISGELLSVITNNTILAKSVGKKYVSADAYNREWMLLGYRNAKKTGIGRACFSGRILGLFAGSPEEQIANYILGVCLQGDVTAIQNSDAVRIPPGTTAVVCGNVPVRTAIRDVLEFEGIFDRVLEYEPEDGMPLASRGAYLAANIRE